MEDNSIGSNDVMINKYIEGEEKSNDLTFDELFETAETIGTAKIMDGLFIGDENSSQVSFKDYYPLIKKCSFISAISFSC
jgi:hypothetical protein